MNISKVFIVILAFSMLFLTACGGSGSSPTNYRTGSQALEMQLINSGTEDVYVGDTFDILVEYFNRGTSDITNGEFFVSGYDLSYMTLYLDPKYINMNGKDQYDPTGRNSQILSIKSSPVRLPQNSDEFLQTVKIVGCYDYTTYATATICVDSDPYNRRVTTNKVCTMSTVSPGSQGAPIVVNSVEPIVSKNDFRLNIEFSNANSGIVFDRSLSNMDCFASLDKYKDMDRVDLTKVDFSGHVLSCSPSNPIRLIDGVGRVTCECKNCVNDYMDAFNTQIAIELKYGYRNEILKNIRVLKD
jgi:hypothetical protein